MDPGGWAWLLGQGQGQGLPALLIQAGGGAETGPRTKIYGRSHTLPPSFSLLLLMSSVKH